MRPPKPIKMSRQRAVQRLVHASDNIGGRDLPHAIIHLQDAKKSSSLKETRDHIERALGHIREASVQSGMQHEVIPLVVPGAAREAKRLAVEQVKSDGLLQKAKPKKVIKAKKTS